jgi:pimeloyl-ACP methyl ester carboxylesterase
LIHGGFHGGWCWGPLGRELERRGHRFVAPTLPITDPSCGNAEYAAIVADALGDTPDDVVVVGHSQGGTTVPYVASMRSVRMTIYLAAAVPSPGESFDEFLVDNPSFLKLQVGESFDDTGCMTIDEEVALNSFFHDCPGDVARWAVAHLRPQAPTPIAETCSLAALPDVPAAYVTCLDDHALDPEGCRQLARDRLGVDAWELPGSHSPFLARPGQLADLLVNLC